MVAIEVAAIEVRLRLTRDVVGEHALIRNRGLRLPLLQDSANAAWCVKRRTDCAEQNEKLSKARHIRPVHIDD